MTLYGENVLDEPGFDNLGSWSKVGDGAPNVVDISGGLLTIERNEAGSSYVRQVGRLTPGVEYLVEIVVLEFTSAPVVGYTATGDVISITKTGLNSGIIVPSGTSLEIACSSAGVSIIADRVSARRIGMAGLFSIDTIDRDNDSRQFSLPTTTITAANHDAQVALHTALVAGIEGISRLVTRKWDVVAQRNETGDPRPTTGSAQVNIEWEVIYVEDTTLDVRTVRIGGANLDIAGILLPGSNVADLTETTMAAFVTAFEAAVLGPNGNAVTVQQVAFLE